MHSRNCGRLALIAASVLLSATAAASDTEVELEIATGYDSNPYRVPTAERGGLYVDFDAGLDYENKLSNSSLFFLSVDGDSTQFTGDVKDASDYSAGIESGMEFNWDLPRRDRFKLKLGAASDLRRGTFVSRFTGQVGETRGTPVPDRFDYNRMSAFVEGDYYLGYDVKLSLDVDFRDKNYVQDYASLGADRLDNSEWKFNPKVEYEFADVWQVEVFGDFAKRKYDDRRADDANGFEIPGSNREYDYQEYGFAFEYEPLEGRQWSFGYSAGNRRDNGGGYWDYDTADFFVRLEQELGLEGEFAVELYRTQKEYDNVIVVANPEEQYARTGNGLKLEYERALSAGGVDDLELFAELDYFDGSESSSRSAYKRTIIMVGVGRTF